VIGGPVIGGLTSILCMSFGVSGTSGALGARDEVPWEREGVENRRLILGGEAGDLGKLGEHDSQ